MSDVSDRNYYELLGVERTAAEEEVRAAYKELVRIFHPDSNYFADIIGDKVDTGADTFKAITSAYKVLVDSAKRAEYDQTLPPVLRDWSAERSHTAEREEPPTQTQTPRVARNETGRPNAAQPPRANIFGASHNSQAYEREVQQVPSVFDLCFTRKSLLERIKGMLGM